MTLDPLVSAALMWRDADPDPVTRQSIDALLGEGDPDELMSCFGHRLQFGTAGIRGALGPGPGRMNRLLVRQVTDGLGRYLRAQRSDAAVRGVVVGYDGRHLSREFAEDVAAVLGRQGVTVHLFEHMVPTPLLAYAVVDLGTAAGVMVTASHNPPADNGYKVYWSNGAQIVPPHNMGISTAIDQAEVFEVEVAGLADLRDAGLLRDVPSGVADRYVAAVQGLRVHAGTDVTAVYTAMHGVGWPTLSRVLEAAGHRGVIAVSEQRDPDGDFPTVAFPNPEEAGALDLAIALATERNADLIIANDPDADRLSVAVPSPTGWRQLSGNEVGLLLADDLLAHGPQGADRVVATTIVSSSMLALLAAEHGATCLETLTGFKWIANAALARGGDFVIGFEEALGYSIGPVVRDKDGISAALVMLDLAAWCQARGETLIDRLEAIYRRHGVAASAQRAFVLPGDDGRARIEAVMRDLRDGPPEALAGHPVLVIRDMLERTVNDRESGETRPLDLPRSNVLAYDLDGSCRVLVRPSGTEPKIKLYFEVIEPLAEGEDVAACEARAQATLRRLEADMVARTGLE